MRRRRPSRRGIRPRLAALALRSPLVLAMDFDGTLAPIVGRPSRAAMPGKVARILRRLARSPGVRLVIVSGRPLAYLRRRFPGGRAALVGLHGISSNVRGVGMNALQARRWRARLAEARRALRTLGLRKAGVLLEDKDLGLALHLRGVAPQGRRRLEGLVRRRLRGLRMTVHRGLRVLELRPTGWDKGRALRRLLARRAPGWKKTGACLYAGDDATDEDAFQALRGMGPMAFGLKIGPGRSRAHGRVPGPAQYWSLLERVLRLRAAA